MSLYTRQIASEEYMPSVLALTLHGLFFRAKDIQTSRFKDLFRISISSVSTPNFLSGAHFKTLAQTYKVIPSSFLTSALSRGFVPSLLKFPAQLCRILLEYLDLSSTLLLVIAIHVFKRVWLGFKHRSQYKRILYQEFPPTGYVMA